jgi:hypothetical protein
MSSNAYARLSAGNTAIGGNVQGSGYSGNYGQHGSNTNHGSHNTNHGSGNNHSNEVTFPNNVAPEDYLDK